MLIKRTIMVMVSSLLLAACVDVSDREDLDTLADTTSAIEGTPILICGDLHNQVFEELRSCNKNGQLGTQHCTETCTIYRGIVITTTLPPGPTTCAITGSDCTPWSCGACVVVGPEGPLGPL